MWMRASRARRIVLSRIFALPDPSGKWWKRSCTAGGPSQLKEANKAWGRPWNSVDVGPKRDLLGDLARSVRAKGMKMGIYYSLYEWFNSLWLNDKPRYVSEHMFPQFKDVVMNYQPSMIFSDGEWDISDKEWRSPELLAWLFNNAPNKDEVVINDRWGKGLRHKHGGYFTTEYGAGMKDASHPWEENRGIGYSFGYNRAEPLSNYRTGEELVWILADLVSRGGNLLLDVGPTADGRIPVIMQDRLAEIGAWLRVNGEAIYGTSTWKVSEQWTEGERPSRASAILWRSTTSWNSPAKSRVMARQ